MIRIFSYSKTSTRMETPSIAELPQHLSDSDRVVWVDLEDPNDEEVGVLGGIFNFHVLAAEDCIDGDYLPKLDGYDAYDFAVLHAVDLGELNQGFQTVGVGFFIGERFLVTHHAKQVKGIFDARYYPLIPFLEPCPLFRRRVLRHGQDSRLDGAPLEE